MAGSLDLRFEALGLEVGAHSGADATCSKGPNDPHEGNQPCMPPLLDVHSILLHRSATLTLMRGTFQGLPIAALEFPSV